MTALLAAVVVGLATGSIYSLVGLGVVLTYKTSGIFNLAHGALATASAYAFYWLHFEHHVAWPIAVFVSVLVFGVAFGLAFERLAGRLQGATLASRIVATVGVLLVIQAICVLLFGNSPLSVGAFLPVGQVTLFGVVVTYDKIIIVGVALVATVVLYTFFRRTRSGKSMRAVVDNPQLLDLAGTNPARVRRVAWMIGCVFATLCGPLLVQLLGRVDPGTLTALVIQAFAAAALGSFTSLPLTYVGGLVIGVVAAVTQNYFGGADGLLGGLPSAMPFVILFVLMLVMPRSRLVLRGMVPRRTGVRWTAPVRVQLMGMLLTLAFFATVPAWAGFQVGAWTTALTFVILFLSLGVLVRMAGQVSLCHATFAAIGAVAFSRLATTGLGIPWLPALIIAGLVAVPVGALLAIPAMRLSGVFLALATFGFGILVQNMFYQTDFMFGATGEGISLPMPDVSWLPLDSAGGFYYVVLASTVVCCGSTILLLRTRLGRLLRGMGDSSLALSTAGLSVTVTTVLVFCISAFLASIAGALYGVNLGVTTGVSFDPFLSATFLALVVIAAGAEPWYALVAALGFVLIPTYWHPDGVINYLQIAFGVFAISQAVLPARGFSPRIRTAIDRLGGRAATPPEPAAPRTAEAPAGDSHRPSGELSVRDLTVMFGGLTAVRGLSLAAPAGKITGLIGPNGAGKTTTFNACSGRVRPAGGRVVFNGEDVSGTGPAERARRGLGRTYQHVELWDSLTVAQNVALRAEAGLAGRSVLRQLVPRRGDRSRVRNAAAEAIRLCGLEDVESATVGSLSTGKRRLVEVAGCLAGDFTVILLDEPSSGLDHYETESLGRLLRRVVDERHVGVLLVEHDMRLVMDVCEYIYVLDFGEEIFQGTPAEVAASPLVRDAYLGSEGASSTGPVERSVGVES